ncbi:hypothetical protein WA026_002600 [Henosepilachna vigintioctopunctata]|uniref:Uncharacterized protein n=1 Tax=Henosepilachna vigintioctopunctata TaxID=420089 RepID=A0AAW1U049_9CUCU
MDDEEESFNDTVYDDELVDILNHKMAHLEKKTGIFDSCEDENQTTHLELENRNTEKLRLEIVALNEKIKSTEKDLRKMSELEIELKKEKEKTKSLNKRIQEAEDDNILSQKLTEIKLKYWDVEKELKNAKIDKKILERELKDANEEIKQLVKQIDMQKNKMQEDKKSQEMALLELNSMNESFSMEIIKLKDKEINHQLMMQEEIKIKEHLNMLIRELKYLKGEKEKTVDRLHSELEDMKIKLGQFRKENLQSVEKLDILSREKVDLQNRLGNAERDNQKIHSVSN